MNCCFSKYNIPQKYSALIRLLTYYLCSLVIAAILSPLCFNSVLLWDQYWPSKLTHYLVQKGFVIFFERIRILALLLFLPSLLKLSRDLQLYKSPFNPTSRCRLFFLYAILGVILIFCVAFIYLFSEKLEFFFTFPEFSLINLFFFIKIIIGVLLLSFFEEWLFRGIIFNSVRKIFPNFLAAVAASLLFAYFHFRPQYQPPAHYGLFSGFQCLYEIIFRTPAFIAWDKFALLFSFGVFLSSAVYYTNSLFASIGIHFGTVLSLIFFQKMIYSPLDVRLISLQTIISSPWTYIFLWGFTLYFYIKKGH